MKVKMLVTMASEKEVKDIGDIVEVKKETAEAWQKADIATIIQEKKAKKKGDK